MVVKYHIDLFLVFCLFQGLVSNVSLDGIILQPWQIYSLDLDRILPKASLPRQPASNQQQGQQQVPTFYVGNLPEIITPQDTYLKIPAKQWSKVSLFMQCNDSSYCALYTD